jgi:hypothetical protein
MPSDLDVLTDNRSDPGSRSVLEDMDCYSRVATMVVFLYLACEH